MFNIRKFLIFALAAVLTSGLTWSLNRSWMIDGNPIPAFGKLMNPFTGFWQNAEPVIGTPPMPVALEGLRGKVEVKYDDRKIPHIFADTLADAIFVQGYLHATDRLFQMDFTARATAGRISELIGPKGINYDLTQRRFGMPLSAKNAVEGWQNDPQMWPLLQAYTAGINAYIATLDERSLPVEYKVLNAKPELWSEYNTALVMKAMTKTLCFGEDDLQASNALAEFGQATFDMLYPETYKEQTPIIPAGTPFNFTPAKATAETPAAPTGYLGYAPKRQPEPMLGSNNWAISGSKSASGHAMLCGDPHLKLTLPSVWYELQMTTPELNTYGVSFPGIPGIMIGFNDYIAWSETNGGHDVADWYNIKWTDATKTKYMVDGQAVAAKIQIDTYYVRDAEFPIFDTLRITQFGPVTYEADSSAYKDMAFRWIAHDKPQSNEMSTFINLMKAKNYDQYAAAISGFNSPAQNFVFAAKNGDIGIRCQGLFPIEPNQQGRFVQDGTQSKNGWKGFVPRDQIPASKNPAQGFVASSNQPAADRNYPYYLHSHDYEGFRGRIANMFLKSMKAATPDTLMAMQNSSFGLHAFEALPLMLKQLDSTKVSLAAQSALLRLKKWDFNYRAIQKAPVLFEMWLDNLYDATWDEITNSKTVLLQPTVWRTILLLRDDPNNRFFDDKTTKNVTEKARDLVTAALNKAATDFATDLAENSLLNWGSYLDAGISHLARMEGFGKPHLGIGGQHRTLNAQNKANGPSWRMIVEMADTTRAWVVYPGGQSGNPGSHTYDAFVDKWSKGEYYEAVFLKNAAAKNDRITFTQTFTKATKTK